MGFFKSLWNKVTDAVGAVLETVGKVTRIEPLEQVGSQLRLRSNPATTRVDMTDSSRYQTRDVIDLHSRCQEVRREADSLARDLEQRCIDSILKDTQEYRKRLETLFDPEAFYCFDYELDEKFVEDIRSTVSSHVARRVSQDDSEFLRILKESDDTRGRSSRAFLDRVMSEAWSMLHYTCRSKKTELYRGLHEAVREYLADQECLIREYEKKLIGLRNQRSDVQEQRETLVEALAEAEYYHCISALLQ